MNSSKTMKIGFDLCHFMIALFLAITSWSALFPALSSKFTIFGGVIMMLLINGVLDLLPFLMGSHISGLISAAYKSGQELATPGRLMGIFIAMVLHTGSASITYLGSDIAAEVIMDTKDVKGNLIAEEGRINNLNTEAKRLALDLSEKAEERKTERLELRARQHESAMEILRKEREAAQKAGYPGQSSRISRQIEKAQDTYQKDISRISGEKVKSYTPEIMSSSLALDQFKQDLEKKQSNQNKVSSAMKFVDIALWLIMAMWYIMIFMLPDISGESYIAINITYYLFFIAKLAYKKEDQINEAEAARGNWESVALDDISNNYESIIQKLNDEAELKLNDLNEKLNNSELLNEKLNNLNENLNEKVNFLNEKVASFRKSPFIQRPESHSELKDQENEILEFLNDVIQDLESRGLNSIQISVNGYSKSFTPGAIRSKVKELFWKIKKGQGREETNLANIEKLIDALRDASEDKMMRVI